MRVASTQLRVQLAAEGVALALELELLLVIMIIKFLRPLLTLILRQIIFCVLANRGLMIGECIYLVKLQKVFISVQAECSAHLLHLTHLLNLIDDALLSQVV